MTGSDHAVLGGRLQHEWAKPAMPSEKDKHQSGADDDGDQRRNGRQRGLFYALWCLNLPP